MNLALLIRQNTARAGTFRTSSLPATRVRCFPARCRQYATQKQLNSDLSQSLDTNKSTFSSRDSVGPFALGRSRPSNDEKFKKWSELSTAGKVQRTTARTTNLTVIVLGAGLSVVLIYCLTSELFSKNSPTVLYNEACDKIKAAPRLSKYLHGPLKFHNDPPSVARPRHRQHQVASQVYIDASGREHMHLNFWVSGRLPGESYSDSWWDSSINVWNRLTELTWDGAVQWTKCTAEDSWATAKRTFKYLVGAPVVDARLPDEGMSGRHQEEKPASSMWSNLRRQFGFPPRRSGQVNQAEMAGRVFTEGEVHADLIMNNEGYFVFRYLLVDLPDSQSPNAIRIFLEKGSGVRENEVALTFRRTN